MQVMTPVQDEGAALLASLETSHDSGSLYLRFSAFLVPFHDFIDDYNPSPVKTKIKKKQIPTKEKLSPIMRQFHQFLFKAVKLLNGILGRSPSNRADGEEEIQEERGTELIGIYRLTIHCLLCLVPCLTGKPYSVHFFWFQLVKTLETWKKYNDAKEESFALLESLNTLLVSSFPHLKPTKLFLPDPSIVGSAGADPQLARLLSELVIVLACCTFKSKTMDVGAFEGLLELTEQLHPWFCIMEPHIMTSHHSILLNALHNCALFLAGESKSFDDDLVYSFCLMVLKECIKSPYANHFPHFAHQICSAIEIQWDRRSSLIIEMLRMSLEGSFSKNLVDIAKFVVALLGFISNCADGFYLTWKDMIGLEFSFKAADFMQQASIALKLCCKSIWKHIKLLCKPQLTNPKGLLVHGESSDLIKDVTRDAFNKCARIINVMHKLGASGVDKVIIKSLCELSFVEVSFPNLSLTFPLVKQWVEMLCADYSEEDYAPYLYDLLLYECPAFPKNIIVEILEQELLAYYQLKVRNPVLCQKMENRVMDILLIHELKDRDFILQRARVFVKKALIYRSRGIENLSSCFNYLTEAISLLTNITYDSYEARTLRCHQLAFAYLTRAQFTLETKQDLELIQCDIRCAMELLSELNFEAHHTLSAQLKPSVKSTIAMLFYTLDLLSLKV